MLRNEAASLHRAGKWQAVVALGERLKSLIPDEPDIDELLSSAQANLDAAEDARVLARAYRRAVKHIGAGEWRPALRELATVQRSAGNYKDSAQLAARARRELAISLPNLDHANQMTTWRAPRRVYAVTFTPDATHLALACDGHQAVIVDLTGQQQLIVRHGFFDSDVNDVAFDPSGQRLATASYSGEAWIWDAATGELLLKIRHGGDLRAVEFSPDGSTLATGSGDRTARIWDAATGEHLLGVAHPKAVQSVTFSPDGRFLATGSLDKTARIWDAITGDQLLEFSHDGHVPSASFNPDGSMIVTGSWDKTARIWDAATGEQLLAVTHDGEVHAVAFSHAARMFATGSEDKTARIWDAATGEHLLGIAHRRAVTSVAFSPDGRMVATASRDDRTVQLWRLVEGDDG